MRDVKLGLARRDERRASDVASADPMSGTGEAGTAERPGTLPALTNLLSRHRTILAALGRSNRLLEDENVRLEHELAAQPTRAAADPPDGTWDPDPLIEAMNTDQKLQWIENYLQSTLAQTLWALDARAVRLEEQLGAGGRQQARQLLDMTRLAYDQLRSLMVWLHGDARG
jgi:hypothetical protein